MPDELTFLLARLADPEAPMPAMREPDQNVLLELARPHGVENILWRKFSAGIDAPGGAGALHRVGQTMLLDGLRRDISGAFARCGVPARVVKGPVFAEHLYSVPGDRHFSDIDLLVDTDFVGEAITIMEGLGYVRQGGAWDNSRRDMEYKFEHPRYPTALVELHGNLVHYPLLRRRVSFGLRELLAAGNGSSEDPAALLATAIVHAALGHKIDRLVMLVDVLQAVRNLPPRIFDRTVATLCELRLGLECAVCLSVVARLFRDDVTAELADRFPTDLRGRIGRLLVSPAAVVRAQGRERRGASWGRRKAFRLVQYLN